MTTDSSYSILRRSAAWGVHFYTALGLPLMFLAALELMTNYQAVTKDLRWFFIYIWIAVIVDSTDGFLARTVKVSLVTPDFSGRRLDDLVDFLSFAFLPSLAFVVFDLLPIGYEAVAIIPIMASGYGFCQEKAKTTDSFVGFPSYWNVVLLYLYLFQTALWINAVVLIVLAVMVFVPIHYLYPSKTKLLMPLTLSLGALWGVSLVALSLYPHADWAPPVTLISLAYPLYYFVVSLIHHRRVHASS